jgi:hypothetical protein
MEYSGIEWTGHTQNFWIGCVKVSPGCKSCYMFRDQRRFKLDPTRIRRTTDRMFTAPLRWKVPAMVFTCSWSDFFLEQADAWRDEAWDIIRRTPHLTWQILTKRPENILARLPHDWGMGWHHIWLGGQRGNGCVSLASGDVVPDPSRPPVCQLRTRAGSRRLHPLPPGYSVAHFWGREWSRAPICRPRVVSHCPRSVPAIRCHVLS